MSTSNEPKVFDVYGVKCVVVNNYSDFIDTIAHVARMIDAPGKNSKFAACRLCPAVTYNHCKNPITQLCPSSAVFVPFNAVPMLQMRGAHVKLK